MWLNSLTWLICWISSSVLPVLVNQKITHAVLLCRVWTQVCFALLNLMSPRFNKLVAECHASCSCLAWSSSSSSGSWLSWSTNHVHSSHVLRTQTRSRWSFLVRRIGSDHLPWIWRGPCVHGHRHPWFPERSYRWSELHPLVAHDQRRSLCTGAHGPAMWDMDGCTPHQMRQAVWTTTSTSSFSRAAMGLFLGLSQRELAQVGMGTHLMLNSLNIEARLVLAGGGSIMEYLTMPQDESYSSGELMCTAPCWCALHTPNWSTWNSGSTALLQWSRQFWEGLACRQPGLPRPTRILAGFDRVTGQYRTSAAKEYPAAFCRALISSGLTSLRSRIDRHGVQQVQWEDFSPTAREWAHRLIEAGKSHFSCSFLPDYQPGL